MKLQNPVVLPVALAWFFWAASARPTLLFQDDFNSANGTSLIDPTARQPALVRPFAALRLALKITIHSHHESCLYCDRLSRQLYKIDGHQP